MIKQETGEAGEGSWGYSERNVEYAALCVHEPQTDDWINICLIFFVSTQKKNGACSRLQYNAGRFWLAVQTGHILHLYLIKVPFC